VSRREFNDHDFELGETVTTDPIDSSGYAKSLIWFSSVCVCVCVSVMVALKRICHLPVSIVLPPFMEDCGIVT